MPDPRPPPASSTGSQPTSNPSSTVSPSRRTAAGPPPPSSPTRAKSDYHLRPPSSPSTRSGMPTASTPLRADAARAQNTSSTGSSPYASLNPAGSGASGHPYQHSVQSSAASFISSTSGDEEGGEAAGARERDAAAGARSAAATTRPLPPSSYAQAARASTSRQPSANRLSTLGSGTPQGAASRQRSSSRARPANRRHNTTTAATANHSAAEDDDEVRVLDRGEELIRRRNRERRAHAAALGRGQSFIDNPNASIGSSTGGGGGGGNESRRVSRSKTPRDRDSLFSQPAQTPTSPFMPVRHGPFEGGSLRREPSRAPSIVGLEGEPDASETGSVAGEPLSHSWHGSVKDAEGEGDEILEDQELDEEADLEDGDLEDGDEGDEDEDADEDVELTLRDRQDAINIEHPFGLPIWKPALYKKSRTVTRQADSALHAIPSAAAQRHLLPGNLAWIVFAGWWLALLCFLLAAVLWCVEGGGRGRYARVIAGLGWYIGWPFGKYVEGEGLRGAKNADGEALDVFDDEGHAAYYHAPASVSDQSDSEGTIRGSPGPPDRDEEAADRVMPLPDRARRDEEADDGGSNATLRNVASTEREPLLPKRTNVAFAADSAAAKGKGRDDDSTNGYGSFQARKDRRSSLSEDFLTGVQSPTTVWLVFGRIVFWPLFILVLAPVMLAVCILCWGGIVTIPMAKLLWALLKLLWSRPLELGFKPAPKVVLPEPAASDEVSIDPAAFIKGERLRAGQVAPTGGPTSTVLLCTYKAVGTQYFKYTIGGVNILFVNLLPLVFFVIFDAFVLLPLSEKHDLGRLLNLLANRGFIFLLSLASVIPLSYFIGMAVASISAQSSIGMGAVINATFGSIIEIILYSIALTQGKGRLVEGSLVGSLLAGVLVMPGMSMLSGAFRRKEQSFNAKSAGVTSTMLIMAILGILTPTVFYQAYGSVELSCSGCPDGRSPDDMPDNQPWMCHSCRYVHPDPAKDPFYQDRVKNLMYICASLLLLSYLIGLWFSLKTHASQIWQNPQQILQQPELVTSAHAVHPAHRASVHNRLPPGTLGLAPKDLLPSHGNSSTSTVRPSSPAPARPGVSRRESAQSIGPPGAMSHSAHSLGSASGAHAAPMPGTLTPFVESIVRKDVKNMPPLSLDDPTVAHDYFAKAVTAATVSALRHQQSIARAARPHSAAVHHEGDGHGGGHEGPSWDRKTSASVLLACTALYAIIAEILVDVVDVILEGSGIDEKFLGVTLFALVPNTTEFMNAMSFALNGNIALSMEIGSAYALQVCLLQIPAMVAFSAIYDPSKMGEYVDTFTLILPQFDCISIMFSIFLLTYTYIEARANYHRGSILILAYLVLLAGFYYAPSQEIDEQRWPLGDDGSKLVNGLRATATSAVDPLPLLMSVAARFRGLFA